MDSWRGARLRAPYDRAAAKVTWDMQPADPLERGKPRNTQGPRCRCAGGRRDDDLHEAVPEALRNRAEAPGPVTPGRKRYG